MSSFVDALFDRYAAPSLMRGRGVDGVATLIYADGETIDGLTAILRQEEVIDEVENNRVVKRRQKEVILSADDSLIWRGMESIDTNAKLLLPDNCGGVECWNVHEVRARTPTFVRLLLLNKQVRSFTRSGFHRQES